MFHLSHMQNKRNMGLRSESGAAILEFALLLPILLVLLLGIIDFGLYFYNDLQLTHVARDAARYASVGKQDEAEAAIANAILVSASVTASSVDIATTGGEARVVLTATYQTVTPLPNFVGVGSTLSINATAVMRRE